MRCTPPSVLHICKIIAPPDHIYDEWLAFNNHPELAHPDSFSNVQTKSQNNALFKRPDTFRFFYSNETVFYIKCTVFCEIYEKLFKLADQI
jgi:hypothetical protein